MIEQYLFLPIFVILITGVIYDLRLHRIPNWLTLSSMLIGVFFHMVINGSEGIFFSLQGLSLGIGLMIFSYLSGWIGAGDVKLIGAIGGFLGPKGIFLSFLYSSISGGIYSILLLAIKRREWKALISSPFGINDGRKFLNSEGEKQNLYYSLPIAFGTIFYTIVG